MLIINRSVEQERRIQRDGLIVIISQACNVALCLGIAYFLTQQKQLPFHPGYTSLPALAASVGIYAMYGQLRWRKINRQMCNLQLMLARNGVTYSSDAGRYSAPWSAVRRIRLQGSRLSTANLIVDVTDWGGPIGGVGRVCRLTIPVDNCGVDELHLKRMIHQLSGGAILTTRT